MNLTKLKRASFVIMPVNRGLGSALVCATLFC
jgi:hypothetical protein